MKKLLIVTLALLALAGFTAPDAFAAGCGRCGKDKCGCEVKECGCKDKCSCAPVWCNDCGIDGFHVDCVDGCCPPSGGTVEVCAETWDVCKKWCDGKYHHPYELVHNGHGMLCDTGCGAYIPCKRKGIVCRTECKEHRCTDGCGCEHVSYSAHTTCDELTRPTTVPWWFNPGHGNVYLDENGKPLCPDMLLVEEAPAPPVAVEPPAEPVPPAVPTPPTPPEPPAPPEAPEEPVVLPPPGGRG